MNLKTLSRLFFCATFGVTVAAVIVFASSEAIAQGRTPYTPIKLHDKNGDGKISRDEWPKQNFDRVDKNKDGFLTPDDFAKHWGVPLPEQGATGKGGGGRYGKRPSAPARRADGSGRGNRGGVRQNCPDDSTINWIDTHVHVPGRGGGLVDVPSAVRAAADVMDETQICGIVLMPTPQVEGRHPPQILEDFLAEARKYPDHFVVLGGDGTLNPMIHDEAADGHVDQGLKDRFTKRSDAIIELGAIGFGEVGVLHVASFRGQQFESVPGDHPLFLLLADITARHDVVIDVHFDLVLEDMDTPSWLPRPPNPPRLKRNLEGFERFLKHNRNAKIVWAHLGSDFIGNRTVE